MYKNGEAQDLPGNVFKVNNLQLQLFHFYSPHLSHNWVLIFSPTLAKHFSWNER